ncbi:TPA: peptide ABC transporter substrate-binding protein [Aeromonas salmonicida]|uniref:peptide ABC transporter substrate-binding protein n=1 Tax=Aeromonas salmonicida TaxID=645 RepID=UPI00285B5729|nr:peptide ABC transporter substrate-binding protein [Aeromonas salmonicida]MDR6994411.1 ABC-type oligopeptide transport system substrate-binding subunit [Aeromonas salmonicida]HEH9412062.1 peptide ABC transporter substrate-binding protein [Aeromonas salmonicida]HEH9420880.1 peptide ABC transporter substrate-binding protein [Aeromonas salmonicida]HEH9434129.1 peptide ABC transporter substrate-binding protein [Aeromonas salmonicida]
MVYRAAVYQPERRPARRWLSPLLLGLLMAPSLQATTVTQETVLSDRQTLVKGNGDEPESLDPAQIRSGFPGEVVLVDLFEGLVSEDGQGKIVPAQAQRWETSEDGLVWRFFLRPQLKWSNGEPLTAQDFVYAWRRLLDPAQGSPSAGLLLATGINNAQSIYAGALELTSLGVEAESSQILKVTLERPVPYFLQLVSQRPFVPVNEQALTRFGKEWTQPGKLVSNGAYKLVNWAPNERIEAERNIHYWDDLHTRIKRVTYLPLSSQHAERLRYEAGEIQLTNKVALEYYQKTKQTTPERIWGLPLLGTYLYTFNLRRPELQDVRVRQALAMTIDRHVLTEQVSGQGERPAWSLLPGMPGYEALGSPLALQDQSTRLAKAAALMVQAGYNSARPLKLTLTYNTSESHKKLALAVAAMWKPLGVEVSLNNMEWSAYQVAKDSGDFMLVRSFLFGDYVEPSSMLNSFRCQDPQNESGYCNPAFDGLLQQASDTLDGSTRTGLYRQAEQLLMDEMPAIPVYHYNQMRLVDPTLRGLPSQNLKGAIATKDLYFSKQ